jgi:hypothetical protein
MTRVSDTGECGHGWSRSAVVAVLAAAVSGCARTPAAPTFTVFGSYFPAWIVCALAGLVLTLVSRIVFVRTGLDEHLPVRLLVYAALTVTWAVAIWFVAFAGGLP